MELGQQPPVEAQRRGRQRAQAELAEVDAALVVFREAPAGGGVRRVGRDFALCRLALAGRCAALSPAPRRERQQRLRAQLEKAGP